MNGNFRRPEFVKRYEYNYYDLETPLDANVANNARQTKNNYRFEVDNSSEANPINWYNAYLEVDFKLVTLVDSTVGITAGAIDNVNKLGTTTNGQTFIKEIQVECNGITVYNNTRANESANILSLLKYTKIMPTQLDKINFSLLIHQQELQKHDQLRRFITKVLQTKNSDRCCVNQPHFNSVEFI